MSAFIESRPMDGGTAYQIIGLTPAEVACAMEQIMDGAAEAHFRPIQRTYSVEDGLKRWRTRGFVRRIA